MTNALAQYPAYHWYIACALLTHNADCMKMLTPGKQVLSKLAIDRTTIDHRFMGLKRSQDPSRRHSFYHTCCSPTLLSRLKLW